MPGPHRALDKGGKVLVLVTLKGKDGCLQRAETHAIVLTNVSHLACLNQPAQFTHTIARYVVVDIIVALTAQRLQHNVTIET